MTGKGMTLDDAVWYLNRAREAPNSAIRDLRKLERLDALDAAGEQIYLQGSGAASQPVLRKAGLPALLVFYVRLGEGRTWPEALQQAFGISPDEFYRRRDALAKPMKG